MQTDHLDTPRGLVDGERRGYAVDETDPFGELVTPAPDTGPAFNQRFPGQYADRETGLSYNRYRYYDPRAGRYTRDDPIGLQGGPNAHLYASAMPTGRIDPLGLADIFIGIEGEIVYLIGLSGGFGFVYDTDSPLQSGFFGTLGLAVGFNFGVAPTGGVAAGDIEGFAVDIDANLGTGSGYYGVGADGQPFAAGTPFGGGGGGASASLSYTGTTSLQDIGNALNPFGPGSPFGPGGALNPFGPGSPFARAAP